MKNNQTVMYMFGQIHFILLFKDGFVMAISFGKITLVVYLGPEHHFAMGNNPLQFFKCFINRAPP